MAHRARITLLISCVLFPFAGCATAPPITAEALELSNCLLSEMTGHDGLQLLAMAKADDPELTPEQKQRAVDMIACMAKEALETAALNES